MASKKSKLKSNTILRVVGKIVKWFFIITIGLTIIYRWINPPITPLMVIRKCQDGATIKKEWVNIEDISPQLIRAAIAAEDNRFLGHKGFDFAAIQRVILQRKHGNKRFGASTISQQTAKNVFLFPDRSWIRKGLEVYFTCLIEIFWSKERIMEVYLNVIETGDGIYGCQEASQIYFHKSAAQLSKRESALMVACFPSPRKRNPAHPTNYLNKQAAFIQNNMGKMGKIAFDKETIAAARQRYKDKEAKRIEKNDGKRLKLYLFE